MYRRTFAILIGVLALAGVAAGCGGDDSDSLTKAEFVKQGDAMCEEVNNDARAELGAFIAKARGSKGGVTPSQEEELVTTVIVPLFQQQLDGLNELGTPEGDAEAEEIIKGMEEVLAEAEANPVGLASSGDPYGKSEQLALDYGFKSCGHS